MKALCWMGTGSVAIKDVPDPKIVDDRDIVIKVTSTAICGSDLHLLDGLMPTMQSGDVLGHEPMGVVEETGKAIKHLKKGDRVVVSFTIACGSCWFCQKKLFSCCDTSNPNAAMAAGVMGHSPAAMLGYSHMLGGFAGGQAQYLRVPFADVGALKIESGLEDDKVLFLSDIFPTGWMGAENADIEKGDTVAVWGCGPVGQFTIKSAWMMGAGRVIALDSVPERLEMARTHGKAETVDLSKTDSYTALQEMTKGRGPDRAIDSVGCEAHAETTLAAIVDKVKDAVMPADRMYALAQCIKCVRKGGTISVPGVYTGLADALPIGAFMNKGLTMKTGQTHMMRYMKPLLQKIEKGEIDPSFVITHRVPLEKAPEMYKTFRDKKDKCIKVVLKP
ncbi:MAG: glutathione-dependent formaldehyde dehydrogenase [Gemmataceae bacterium]|nr:glutathione-dependent formaldehyde dehydrogenase [Gemmataceae bacterium]